MRIPSAGDILRVWELGRQRPAWYRALLLLAPAFPDLKRHDLAALSIGRRNAYLYALRQRMLGTTLNALARCPQCQDQLEFEVNVGDVFDVDWTRPLPAQYDLSLAEFDLRFRLPNSEDFVAITATDDVEAARRLLINRCVVQAFQHGQKIEAQALPPAIVTALAEQINERDPQADVRLGLSCPTCGHGWAAGFDIVSFFWTELEVVAQRLLNEVHLLARAYGWRESDILSMSPVRRRAYIERLI